MLSTNQTHATNYILLKDPGYEAKDFAAVAGLADLQHLLVVRNELPVRSEYWALTLMNVGMAELWAGHSDAARQHLEDALSRTRRDRAGERGPLR